MWISVFLLLCEPFKVFDETNLKEKKKKGKKETKTIHFWSSSQARELDDTNNFRGTAGMLVRQ